MGTWEWDVIHDLHTWSSETEALCGLAPGTFDGTFAAFQRTVHPEDWPALMIKLRAPIPEQRYTAATYRTVWPDGTVRWLENKGRAIYSANGTLKRVTGTTMDITARKEAETRDRLLTAALEASANAVVITDRDGRVEWANQAFTDLTGYLLAEAMGQSTSFLKSGAQDARFYRGMWETVLAGEVWQGELVNRRKDGSRYTEEMTITPVRDEAGVIAHFVAIKQDVTSRRDVQLRLQAEPDFAQELINSVGLGSSPIRPSFGDSVGLPALH